MFLGWLVAGFGLPVVCCLCGVWVTVSDENRELLVVRSGVDLVVVVKGARRVGYMMWFTGALVGMSFGYRAFPCSDRYIRYYLCSRSG